MDPPHAIGEPGSSSQQLFDQDVCLFTGGPLFTLLRRAHLSDDALGLIRRRIAAFILIAWAPLLLLSVAQGGFMRGERAIAFVDDIECQVRFLIAVPLLVYAELFVHRRLRVVIGQFASRELVRPDERRLFDDAVAGILRLRNSIFAEVMIISGVYAVGIFIVWRQYTALDLTSWYSMPAGSGQILTLAGYWYAFISLPLFKFLLLRWYFRLFIWARFLWKVSRLNLDLDALHPDKAGGLGFLSISLRAYFPLALAHGALLSGWMANRIYYAEFKLTDFLVQVFLLVALLLLIFVGPLLAFTPMLEKLQRITLDRYGALGQAYVRAFGAKWLSGALPKDEALLGSGDIQSLADLRNSYAVADEMQLVPFSIRAVVEFVIAILVPIAPLVLTQVPAEELIGRLFGILQ